MKPEPLKKYTPDNKTILLLVAGAFVISRLVLILIHGMFNGGISVETFLRDQNRFDATWYLFTMEEGYLPSPFGHNTGDAANWAFFPLMPLVCRGLHKITGLEYILFVPVFNSLLFLISQFVIFKYMMKTRDDFYTAVAVLLFFNFGPYTFYFSSMYTESMFILFVSLFLWFMSEKKYLLMGVAGLLASATRNIGVFLVFAPFVMTIEEYLKKEGKKSFGGYMSHLFSDGDLVLGTCLVPGGLFAYIFYLYRLTGDGLAFLHIQRAWNETDDYNFFKEFLGSFGAVYDARFYFAAWTILGILALLYHLYKKRFYELTLCFIFMAIPLSVRMISIPRYLIGSLIPVLAWAGMI
ncbi:MAG: hypothetical protein IKT14_02170, partial [Clostridiales bacterium]|nr:hypothetical protein [Clostridiales bacterium]